MERGRLPINSKMKRVLLVSVESLFAFAHLILGIKGPVGTLNVTTIASVVRILFVGNVSRIYVILKKPSECEQHS